MLCNARAYNAELEAPTLLQLTRRGPKNLSDSELQPGHPCFCRAPGHGWHENPGILGAQCSRPVFERTQGDKVKKVCDLCRQSNDALEAANAELEASSPPIPVGPDGKPIGARIEDDDDELDEDNVSVERPHKPYEPPAAQTDEEARIARELEHAPAYARWQRSGGSTAQPVRTDYKNHAPQDPTRGNIWSEQF